MSFASVSRPARRRGAAFTLVELLVVIGVIALLISMLLPALRKAREQAAMVKCMSNQRQLMQAFLMFAQDHKGRLPGNFTDYNNPDTEKRSWLYNYQEPLTNAPRNGTIWRYVNNVEVYLCPSLQADNVLRGTNSNGQFDYVSFAVFAGAKISNIKNESRHVFPGGARQEYLPTPIICEEGASALNRDNIEGFHNGSDPIANTHPWTARKADGTPIGGGFYASIDGSVHYFKEPKGSAGAVDWWQKGPRGRDVNFGETGFQICWGWWDNQ